MSSYELYNKTKEKAINDLFYSIQNDPVSKLESYDTMVIETEDLLKREQTYFIINSIVTVGLIITLFQVI
jgi:hypothetical protein